PSTVRPHVPFVPLTQTTLELTTASPRKSASESTDCFCHWLNEIDGMHNENMKASIMSFIAVNLKIYFACVPNCDDRMAAEDVFGATSADVGRACDETVWMGAGVAVYEPAQWVLPQPVCSQSPAK